MASDPQKHSLLRTINRMTASNILDESDELLSCHVQLIYAWGDKEPLPQAHERFEVVQELLHVLATSKLVACVLNDPNVAEVTWPREGYGRSPLVRLVPGVLVCLLQSFSCQQTAQKVCVIGGAAKHGLSHKDGI